MSGMDVKSLSTYSLFKVRGEDSASLLTSSFTFYALILTSAFLSGVQLIGEPIECWCPAQITDAMCNYTKSVCWISRQYFIDLDEAIPRDQNLKREVQQREMSFYPLIPFILLLLALALKLPSFLWNSFQGTEGINIVKAVQMATQQNQDDEQSGQNIAFEMTFRLNNNWKGRSKCLSVKKMMSAWALFFLGSDVGTYQTGLFLFTRLLAIVVNVMVYPALGFALQMDYVGWGLQLLKWAISKDDDEEDPTMYVFPRETLCDFRVRQLQNVHDYTVQCVLPINMWSEKVFLVLWFWLLFLLLLNLHSYTYWFRKLLLSESRHALLTKHLTILYPDIKRTCRKQIADFSWNYLSYDSVLVLRILEKTAGNRLANVVVDHLWSEYNRRLESVRPSTSDFWADTDLTGPD